MPKTILLIHGAWLTPASWDNVRHRYAARGYRCVAPPWPMMEGPADELRRLPHPRLGKLSIARIAEHFEEELRTLSEDPIIMGHSFGGLIALLLLDRGLGSAGVVFDPAPPRGVLPGLTTIRTSWSVLSAWNGWNRVLSMSFDEFRTGFANRMPEADREFAYDEHIVPAPGRIFFQAALGVQNRVRWDNPDRAPLLIVEGAEDRTVQPSMAKATFRRARRSPSLTAYWEFEHRSHFLTAEPGWEEVADYALDWAVENSRTRPAIHTPISVRAVAAPQQAGSR